MIRMRYVFAVSALTLIFTFAGLLGPPLQAQEPVYPVYDGFVRNPDGSLTLSFAYFSHNPRPVTIPVGPDNSVTPAPDDRGQPTTFLPGHHRFQCIMVVGSDFDGTLRWTVSYAATSTSTSEDMLQYNWELDQSGTRQALRAVDPATAPRGICLNRPPIVRLLGLDAGPDEAPPEVSVGLREAMALFGSVRDEGLPRDGALTVTWSMVSGPGTVSFVNPTQARTHVSFGVPGTYELELSASDSELDESARLKVIVTSAP